MSNHEERGCRIVRTPDGHGTYWKHSQRCLHPSSEIRADGRVGKHDRVLTEVLLHTRVMLSLVVGLLLEQNGLDVKFEDREEILESLRDFVIDVGSETEAAAGVTEVLKMIFEGTSNN